ncbi:MAG TPA: outer membrane beta-barrel protein [Anaeromyxobacteraceae bacterium]|nr:outer membrane beta-barrel protein [Anaeromyxobacteraceae bacterium]
MKPALAAALAAVALSATPARAADFFINGKLGYLWPSGEVMQAGGNFGKVDPKLYWEAGLGLHASVLGLELTGGRFSSTNSTLNLSVSSVPVLLAVQLRIPIPVVTPYVEAGGGAFFNKAEIPGAFSESHTTWGYVLGGGVDIRIEFLLLGVEARYLSADAGIPNVTLRVDSATLTGKVGFFL